MTAPILWAAHIVLGTLPASRRGRRAEAQHWHRRLIRHAAEQRGDMEQHARALEMAAAMRRAAA